MASKPELCESDEYVDAQCEPCFSEGVSSVADKFCQECAHALCITCVKQHARFPALRRHVIVELSARRMTPSKPTPTQTTTQTTKLKTTPTLKCEDHTDQLVTMYCLDHDETGCTYCVSTKHRKCTDVQYIPEVAKCVQESEECMVVLSDTHQSIASLEEAIGSKRSKLAAIAAEKTLALQTLDDLVRRMKGKVDDLEKETKIKINSRYINDSSSIQESIDAYISDVRALENTREHLDENKINDSDRFIVMKKGKQRLNEIQKTQHTVNSKIVGILKFRADKQLESLVDSMSILGEFVVDEKPVILGKLYYRNIRSSYDKGSCDISGIAELHGGQCIVITDWANEAVKLLDKYGKVVCHQPMPSVPASVCSIGADEVAVSLPMQGKIQFMTINNDRITPTKTLPTIIPYCRSLAYFNGLLYVTCCKDGNDGTAKLLVYTLSGHCQLEVKCHRGEAIFSTPEGIAVVDHGERIFVTDYNKGVIVINKTGHVLSVMSDPSHQNPVGICAFDPGRLLVCFSDGICQLDTDGRYVGTVYKKDDTIKAAKLFYCIPGKALLMACDKSDVLFSLGGWF